MDKQGERRGPRGGAGSRRGERARSGAARISAREVARQALSDVVRSGSYVSAALDRHLNTSGLSAEDKRLAASLFYTAVENRLLLEARLASFLDGTARAGGGGYSAHRRGAAAFDGQDSRPRRRGRGGQADARRGPRRPCRAGQRRFAQSHPRPRRRRIGRDRRSGRSLFRRPGTGAQVDRGLWRGGAEKIMADRPRPSQTIRFKPDKDRRGGV